MSQVRFISVPCYIQGRPVTDAPHIQERIAVRMANAMETMRALAAKRGRVIVIPTLLFEEQRPAGHAAVGVVAHAQTAARPGWRKTRNRDSESSSTGEAP